MSVSSIRLINGHLQLSPLFYCSTSSNSLALSGPSPLIPASFHCPLPFHFLTSLFVWLKLHGPASHSFICILDFFAPLLYTPSKKIIKSHSSSSLHLYEHSCIGLEKTQNLLTYFKCLTINFRWTPQGCLAIFLYFLDHSPSHSPRRLFYVFSILF